MRYTIALAALALSTTMASAAPFDWAGFYAGISGGLGSGAIDFPSSYDEADMSMSGAQLGVQLGYNYVLDNGLIVGIEGEAHWAGLSGRALVDMAGPPWGDQYEAADFRWMAALTPRIGYAMDNLLVYGKAGVVLANVDAHFEDNFTHPVVNQTWLGAQLGAGMEYAVTENVTAGLEYNLNLFGGAYDNSFTSYDVATTTQAVLFRLNFHTP